jgi:hypothetical protein
MGKDIPSKWKQKQEGIALLTSDKAGFKQEIKTINSH